MAAPVANAELVGMVDYVCSLIDRALAGDSFAQDDLKVALPRLRKALTTRSSGIIMPASAARMQRSWQDSVQLYKWGRAALPPKSTVAEIYAWLRDQPRPFPGELRHCRLAATPANFARYVKAGLKAIGTGHRLLKGQMTPRP